MASIRAGHYDDTEKWLSQHPVIIAMAAGLRGTPRNKLAHADGTPLFEFMKGANREFYKRGGKFEGRPPHIGAVATALLMVLDRG
jgi:hypothetical protein